MVYRGLLLLVYRCRNSVGLHCNMFLGSECYCFGCDDLCVDIVVEEYYRYKKNMKLFWFSHRNVSIGFLKNTIFLDFFLYIE